jgi:sulfide dehydrogenase cytochrome subunit
MVYKKAKKALFVAGLAFCASTTAVAEGMTGASASMLANTCSGCHGTNGASVGPAAPTIGGLSEDYFIDVMERFASGDVPSTIMGRIANGYSGDEIEKMAGFFAEQEFVPAKQEFDAGMAESGAKLHDMYCEKCHEEGGQLDDGTSRLAGQWVNYLEWTMADITAQHREVSKKMWRAVEKMINKQGDESIAQVIHYYASQQ